MKSHVGEDHRIVGVGFQEVDLLLELEGVGPVVVTLAEGDVFGPGGDDGAVHHARHRAVSFGVLVFGLVKGLDDVGVAGGVFADDVGGAVGRGVVVDDGHEREVGLLHHEPFEGVADIGLVVVGDAADGHQRARLG